MRTEDLVAMLATGAGAVAQHESRRRYAAALAGGALGATLLMLALLGPRPDLAAALRLPMFWVKFGFVACLAAAGLAAALRMSTPGRRLGWVAAAAAAPVAAIWLLAAVVLARADAAQRVVAFFGDTWNSCPFLIALLSAPVFAGAIWAMRGLAPTRLRPAGAAAGLLAGGVGAMVYSVHCPEMAAPFIGFWYLLGVLIPTALGALLGPRLLRW